jgi:hypothetical protein
VQRIGSRLGKNLDSPVTDTVEFGGEGILVDANLADGRLGRQRPAGKSVNVNLPAVGTGRGSGQSRQFVGKLVGIVGESIQVRTLEDDGAGVAAGLHVDHGRLIGNRYALLLNLHGHGNVHTLDLTGRKLNGRRSKGSEARIGSLHKVAAGTSGRSQHRRQPSPRWPWPPGCPPR